MCGYDEFVGFFERFLFRRYVCEHGPGFGWLLDLGGWLVARAAYFMTENWLLKKGGKSF